MNKDVNIGRSTRWNVSKLPRQLAYEIVRRPSKNQIDEGFGLGGLTHRNAFKNWQSPPVKCQWWRMSAKRLLSSLGWPALHFFVFCSAALSEVAAPPRISPVTGAIEVCSVLEHMTLSFARAIGRRMTSLTTQW
jgi:hypothetical protein